jgi:uncharacterized protein
VTEIEKNILINIFSGFPQIDQAVLFGSRALGSNKMASDIDIALKGEQINDAVMAACRGQIDESPLPYMLDLVHYNQLTNNELIHHIDEFGKKLYQR